jgi:hypothetical protein
MGWEVWTAGGLLLLASPFAVFLYAKLVSYGWRLGAYKFDRDLEKGKIHDGT